MRCAPDVTGKRTQFSIRPIFPEGGLETGGEPSTGELLSTCIRPRAGPSHKARGKRGELWVNVARGIEMNELGLPEEYWEILKAEYPRRYGDQGWIAVRTLIPRAITAGAKWTEILEGTRAYRRFCDATGKTGTELVKQAKTFYGFNQLWTEDYSAPEPKRTAAEQALERRWETLRARAVSIGFRAPLPIESPDAYETQIRLYERDRPKVVALR